jgi:hypothetical protein
MTILNSFGAEWNDQQEHDSYAQLSISSNTIHSAYKFEPNMIYDYCLVYFPIRDEIYFQTYLWFDFGYERYDTYTVVDLFTWLNEFGDIIGRFNIHKDNTLTLYIGDNETLKFTTTKPLYDNTWYTIELRIKIHDTNGNLTFRLDGEELYSFDGNTLPSTSPSTSAINSIRIRVQKYYTQMYLDNIVVNDTYGTVNNSWPAGTKIRLIVPSANGTSSQWTRSGGSNNYQCVDSRSTDFVYANNTNLLDLYGMQDLNAEANKILWVAYNHWIQGSSLTVKNFTPVVRISGNNYFATTKNIPYSIDLIDEYLETSPATSAAWGVSELNDIEFGMRSES